MQGFETGELSPRAGDEIRTLGMDMKEAASDAQDKVTSSVREQAAKIGEKAKTVASDAGRKIEGALNDQRDLNDQTEQAQRDGSGPQRGQQLADQQRALRERLEQQQRSGGGQPH